MRGGAWVAIGCLRWMEPLLFYIVQKKKVLVCPDSPTPPDGFIHVVDHIVQL